MFILKKGHQPGVYMPLRALFLVLFFCILHSSQFCQQAYYVLIQAHKIHLLLSSIFDLLFYVTFTERTDIYW